MGSVLFLVEEVEMRCSLPVFLRIIPLSQVQVQNRVAFPIRRFLFLPLFLLLFLLLLPIPILSLLLFCLILFVLCICSALYLLCFVMLCSCSCFCFCYLFPFSILCSLLPAAAVRCPLPFPAPCFHSLTDSPFLVPHEATNNADPFSELYLLSSRPPPERKG